MAKTFTSMDTDALYYVALELLETLIATPRISRGEGVAADAVARWMATAWRHAATATAPAPTLPTNTSPPTKSAPPSTHTSTSSKGYISDTDNTTKHTKFGNNHHKAHPFLKKHHSRHIIREISLSLQH